MVINQNLLKGTFFWKAYNVGSGTEIISHGLECVFFEAADLRLRNADFIRNFHLCFALIKTHFNNMPFPTAEAVHGFFERQIFQPVFFFVFAVTDLIHDIKRIAAFGIDGFIEADHADSGGSHQ